MCLGLSLLLNIGTTAVGVIRIMSLNCGMVGLGDHGSCTEVAWNMEPLDVEAACMPDRRRYGIRRRSNSADRVGRGRASDGSRKAELLNPDCSKNRTEEFAV